MITKARCRKQRTKRRRGYALVTVMIFLVLMLTLMGVARRHLASVLRVEQSRVQAEHRDEGLMHALAQAMQLLETGRPPSSPYVCSTIVTTSLGAESFRVIFNRSSPDHWTVRVTPTPTGQNPPPMPTTF